MLIPSFVRRSGVKIGSIPIGAVCGLVVFAPG